MGMDNKNNICRKLKNKNKRDFSPGSMKKSAQMNQLDPQPLENRSKPELSSHENEARSGVGRQLHVANILENTFENIQQTINSRKKK